MKKYFTEEEAKMANKHMKIYLKSLATKEIKGTVRCHYTYINMAAVLIDELQ